MQRLFLIDAYALVFKYYYAFIGRPMRNRAGLNTSIIYGFTKFLRETLQREKPDLLAVVFDPPGGSFRREVYPAYKANRPQTPEDIIASVPYIKRIAEAMGIAVVEVAGFEADDVIGTLAVKGEEAGYDVMMVTPDKDYGQLVGEHRKIYKQRGDEIEIIDTAGIKAKYGIDEPRLVADILALWGDASDNIPGVPGIGEKGASKIVAAWGDTENIIANAENIGGKAGANIAATAEQLRLAKRLTTIRLDVPIEFRKEEFALGAIHVDTLRSLFSELNFSQFLADLRNMVQQSATTVPVQEPQVQLANVARMRSGEIERRAMEGQGSLFDEQATAEPELFAEVQTAQSQQLQQQEVAVSEDDLFVYEGMASIATVVHRYDVVQSSAELRYVVSEAAKYNELSFVLITSGLDPFACHITGIALAVRPHYAWYVPMGDIATTKERMEIVKPLFENSRIAKVGHNIKHSILFLRQNGVELQGRKYDTLLMHYIVDPVARHKREFVAEACLNYKAIAYESVVGSGARQLSPDMIGIEQMCEYAAESADIGLQLRHKLFSLVRNGGLLELYNNIEEPLIDVLADMEWEGVRIDTKALADYSRKLASDLAEIEAKIRRETDEPWLNLNSSRQVGELLFGKMRIDPKPKMTKTKQYCTDEEYLQSFADTCTTVADILEYRGIRKLLSTYVDALPLLVNSSTGRIHTSYNQATTSTGRLSSSNPNLQNIPVREAIGQPIRAAFVPADDEHTIVAADYSQVELRLMAHLSGDEGLCEAFRHGEDIHAATAAKIFGKQTDEVTKEERRRAKTANFGIIYGISSFGLSQRLKIPRAESKALIEGYFATYPGVKAYMERSIAMAREKGYVETMFGRRLTLPDIHSRNANARALAERVAINAPIQGGAADIMKIAMVRMWRRMREEGLRSRIIMQVHDEVVVDCLRSEEQVVRRILAEEMSAAASLAVPLVVDCNSGASWLEAH